MCANPVMNNPSYYEERISEIANIVLQALADCGIKPIGGSADGPLFCYPTVSGFLLEFSNGIPRLLQTPFGDYQIVYSTYGRVDEDNLLKSLQENGLELVLKEKMRETRSRVIGPSYEIKSINKIILPPLVEESENPACKLSSEQLRDLWVKAGKPLPDFWNDSE